MLTCCRCPDQTGLSWLLPLGLCLGPRRPQQPGLSLLGGLGSGAGWSPQDRPGAPPPPRRAPGPCGWEQVLALQGSGATRADGCVGRLGPGQGAHTLGSWARESRPCADRMTSDSATGPAGPGQGPVSWDHPPLSLGPKPGLAACMNRLAHSGRPRGDGQGCRTVSWGARTGPTCRAPPNPQRVP